MVNKKLEALAEKWGADLYDDDDMVTLYSPSGTVWVATGCHTLTCGSAFTTRAFVIRELTEDANKGLDECDDPDCEICEENSVGPSR